MTSFIPAAVQNVFMLCLAVNFQKGTYGTSKEAKYYWAPEKTKTATTTKTTHILTLRFSRIKTEQLILLNLKNDDDHGHFQETTIPAWALFKSWTLMIFILFLGFIFSPIVHEFNFPVTGSAPSGLLNTCNNYSAFLHLADALMQKRCTSDSERSSSVKLFNELTEIQVLARLISQQTDQKHVEDTFIFLGFFLFFFFILVKVLLSHQNRNEWTQRNDLKYESKSRKKQGLQKNDGETLASTNLQYHSFLC